MEDPTRIARQPGRHFGMLVGGIVVEDNVDQLAGRDLALDGIEEADEFAMPVALHAATNDGAVEHTERGEQRRGAMPLVVMGHGPAASGLDRQSRLSAVERLDLALFVDRQHHGTGWRIDIEPNNVAQFGGKARIARALEGAAAVCAPARCAAPNRRKCRWLWPSPGRSNGSFGAAARCRSAPPPALSFPRRSGSCRACGSCRATDPRPRSRQSAAAIATPSAG